MPSRGLLVLRLVALLGGAMAIGVVDAQPDRSVLARGFATLRAMDCARCHGGDYRGQSGPSLLDAVREGGRERFDRYVLDGDLLRGMPGYREQPMVVSNLDAVHAYLLARANGEIGPGNPAQ